MRKIMFIILTAALLTACGASANTNENIENVTALPAETAETADSETAETPEITVTRDGKSSKLTDSAKCESIISEIENIRAEKQPVSTTFAKGGHGIFVKYQLDGHSYKVQFIQNGENSCITVRTDNDTEQTMSYYTDEETVIGLLELIEI